MLAFKSISLVASLMAAATSCVSAQSTTTSDLTITSPAAGGVWYDNFVNSMTWTGRRPDVFNVQVINDDTSILANGISVYNFVPSSAGRLSVSLGTFTPASGYRLRLYSVTNISESYTTSAAFSIQKPPAGAVNGTALPPQAGGGAASTTPSSATGTAGAGTANGGTTSRTSPSAGGATPSVDTSSRIGGGSNAGAALKGSAGFMAVVVGAVVAVAML